MARSFALTVDLPEDLLQAVRARVSAGEFTDESEAVADALRLAFAEDAEFDRFLGEVAASIDAHAVDSSGAVPIEDAMAILRERYRARQGNV